MADTSKAQKAAEEYVIGQVLPQMFKQNFVPRKVGLEWGGLFAYDGVSDDGKIIVCVSTSEGVTATGNFATSKVFKLAKDVLMMLFTPSAEKRVLALTEMNMVNAVKKIQEQGRFPPSPLIEVIHTPLTDELRVQLDRVRARSREEVTPSKLV